MNAYQELMVYFAELKQQEEPHQGVSIVTEVRELRSALNLMLTYFGMDEDGTNHEVFEQARKALLING